MTDRPQSDKRTTRASGIVLFLVDESISTETRIAGGTKSKSESVATVLNSLLNQLSAVGQVDVALIGYRGTPDGNPDVGSRWSGPLAGNDFIAIDRVATSPVSVENRVRKTPTADGIGVFREETVPFPIWYVPTLGPVVGSDLAFDACRAVLERWMVASGPTPKPPMIFHFHGDDTRPQVQSSSQDTLSTSAVPPLVFHAHLGTSTRIPATLYPSTGAHLPPGMVCDLFDQSSLLPQPFVDALASFGVPVNPGARGLVHNGRMVDLIRLFSLAKTYIQLPSPAPSPKQPEVAYPIESSKPLAEDPAVALMLVLDRSVDDRFVDQERNVCQRLQVEANDLLSKIAKRKSGHLSVGLVTYGTGSTGEVEIEIGFAGPLAGRPLVEDVDLIESALRVEEVCEQVSNGIGGLVEVTRKKPIYLDFPPAKSASPVLAFGAVRDLLAPWHKAHPQSTLGAIILHLTRGEFDPIEVDEAFGSVREDSQIGPLIYHLVLTETPHRSVAYPFDPSPLDGPILKQLFQLSGPLWGAHLLATMRPNVSPQSRGMVVNGRFDRLLDGLDAVTPGFNQ